MNELTEPAASDIPDADSRLCSVDAEQQPTLSQIRRSEQPTADLSIHKTIQAVDNPETLSHYLPLETLSLIRFLSMPRQFALVTMRTMVTIPPTVTMVTRRRLPRTGTLTLPFLMKLIIICPKQPKIRQMMSYFQRLKVMIGMTEC